MLDPSLTLEDCNWKHWMKEQNQLKIAVKLNRIFPKHACCLPRTRRSMPKWPAFARRRGRILMRRLPTSTGMRPNVRIKAGPPASPPRSATASQRFVNTSWVEIVLAGESSLVKIVIFVSPSSLTSLSSSSFQNAAAKQVFCLYN